MEICLPPAGCLFGVASILEIINSSVLNNIDRNLRPAKYFQRNFEIRFNISALVFSKSIVWPKQKQGSYISSTHQHHAQHYAWAPYKPSQYPSAHISTQHYTSSNMSAHHDTSMQFITPGYPWVVMNAHTNAHIKTQANGQPNAHTNSHHTHHYTSHNTSQYTSQPTDHYITLHMSMHIPMHISTHMSIHT